MVLGAAAMITGFNSCKKDKDDDKGIECCTRSYMYDGATYKSKACEDGTASYTVTYNGETTETYTYDWRDTGYTWSELKQEMLDYGATCD